LNYSTISILPTIVCAIPYTSPLSNPTVVIVAKTTKPANTCDFSFGDETKHDLYGFFSIKLTSSEQPISFQLTGIPPPISVIYFYCKTEDSTSSLTVSSISIIPS
jgi:hypothetical protein